MNLIDQNSEIEEDILQNITKESFFKYIQDYKIDLIRVANKKKNFNDDFHRFNLIIKKLKKERKITMVDCAKYLLTDFFKESEVLDCFNDENKYELSEEIKTMFRKQVFDKKFSMFF